MLTDYMNHCTGALRPYESVVPIIGRLLNTLCCRNIIDLGSGGGGPWLQIHEELNECAGEPITVTLTDKYPSENARLKLEERDSPWLRYWEMPVDAQDVKGVEGCFRTMFSSFHHFKPEEAQKILSDAARRRVGIGVFEITARGLAGLMAELVAPFILLAVTPWIRPFSWRRLLWTYLLPVIPFCIGWDGVVSSLRTYTLAELREMACGLAADDYVWEISRFPKRGVKGTYLIGYPQRRLCSSGQEEQ